jgi:hypothetical protein
VNSSFRVCKIAAAPDVNRRSSPGDFAHPTHGSFAVTDNV